jgi:hypothetical protein
MEYILLIVHGRCIYRAKQKDDGGYSGCRSSKEGRAREEKSIRSEVGQ